MRLLTLLPLLLLLLIGCSNQTAEQTPIPSSSGGPSNIQMVVASDDFAVGRMRVPFVLYIGPDRAADVQQVKIMAFDLSEESPQPVWSGAATGYNDYEVPYWVVYPEFSHAGFWGLGAEITLADGSLTQGQFAIEVKEESSAPAVGSRPPASQNRTLETEPDIAKLSSDFSNPEPELYQMTVADVLTAAQPAVITFSTPAFCATQLCVPVLDSVKVVHHDLKERANFIHIEVYKLFDPLVVADEVTEWGLTSEPWTFVLDSNGRIVAKFGGPLSPDELIAALTPLLP